MTKPLIALAALSFAVSAAGARTPARVLPPPPLTIEDVADIALTEDERAWDFVEGITTEVGPRQAGTEA